MFLRCPRARWGLAALSLRLRLSRLRRPGRQDGHVAGPFASCRQLGNDLARRDRRMIGERGQGELSFVGAFLRPRRRAGPVARRSRCDPFTTTTSTNFADAEIANRTAT